MKEQEQIDRDRFERAVREAAERAPSTGIGTLSEKTVHAVLKCYFAPDETEREVPVGRFTADIVRGNEIIEIQTRSFDRMREKLASYPEDYRVTLVCPVPHEKHVVWINTETGETTKRRKSPKRGRPSDALRELAYIRSQLHRPGLTVRIVMLDVTEYRYLDGYGNGGKRGSTRADRIPEAIAEIIDITSLYDWAVMLPETIGARFRMDEFARETRLSPRAAWSAMAVLCEVGIVRRIGKDGRAYIYERQ